MDFSVVCLLCSIRWLSLGPSVRIQIKAFEYFHAVLFSVECLQQGCDFLSVLYTHLSVDDEMFWSILVTEVQRLTHR